MRKMGYVALAIAVLMGTAYAYAGILGFSNDTIRYKVTVAVETSEGLKTGSTVREASKHTEPSILPEQGGATYTVTNGEAVAVDLGQKGFLFGLIGGADEGRNVYQTLKNEKNQFTEDPTKNVRFVRFRNLRDPKTVEVVTADNAKEKLNAEIKAVSIEMTKEPVTTGLVKVLPWLPEYRNKRLDGYPYDYQRAQKEFAHSLGSGSFLIMEK